MNPPWYLAYLGFTDANGYSVVIYQRAAQGGNSGLNNPGEIAYLPADLQAEATWAYGLR